MYAVDIAYLGELVCCCVVVALDVLDNMVMKGKGVCAVRNNNGAALGFCGGSRGFFGSC